MRIPKIESRNYNAVEKEQTMDINFYIKPDMIDRSWQEDEKSYSKFIKAIEKIVRGSIEYRNYVKFLKEEVDMNQCAFFQNVDRTELRVGLEIHHAPLTLFDICSIVLNDMALTEDNITVFDVAEEVLQCHYQGLVGLIPLSETVHELVHEGDVFIPVNKVYGNVRRFIEKYGDGLTENHIDLLNKAIDASRMAEGYSPAVLEKKITYLRVKGMELPKLINIEQEELA